MPPPLLPAPARACVAAKRVTKAAVAAKVIGPLSVFFNFKIFITIPLPAAQSFTVYITLTTCVKY
jgi:hypothetical protein